MTHLVCMIFYFTQVLKLYTFQNNNDTCPCDTLSVAMCDAHMRLSEPVRLESVMRAIFHEAAALGNLLAPTRNVPSPGSARRENPSITTRNQYLEHQ